MLTVRKIGKSFYADLLKGSTRIRGAFGTPNKDAAYRLARKLDNALADGPDSELWLELRKLLPQATFARFAEYVGWREKQLPTWIDLRRSFEAHLEQRIAIGKFRESTAERYKHTLREFEAFLAEQKITLLQDITKPIVEAFKVWRKARIKGRKFARGGTSITLDAAVLHRAFAFALENEMILRNPVRMEGRPGENPEGGAEPFTADELSRLRDKAGDDLLTFLLLRHTGLRGGDAVALTWAEVHFDRKEIERVTQKRKKKVIIPIQTELLFALETECDKRNPEPTDRVLINPATGEPMTRPRLYERVLALGRRAGVADAHPHRFRDTLAVDMLSKGATPYFVAKMLGDIIETVEKHYAPFVPELRERLRRILESEGGLEDSEKYSVKHPSRMTAKVM
jgi:integrase